MHSLIPRALRITAFAALALAACNGPGPVTAPPSAAAPTSFPGGSFVRTSAVPSQALPSIALPSLAIPSVGGAGSADVCSLFQAAELERLTGHKLASTTPGTSQGASVCTWDFESGTPGVNWELIIEVTSPGGRQAFLEAKPIAAHGSPVPGLGDDNYPVIANTIFAIKGDTMVSVQYINLGSDPNVADVTVQIVKLALQRLP